ncbi:hypothetical protein ACROYT_G016385 [Oculina patagonica]
MKTSDADNKGTPISYSAAGRQNELVIRNYKNFRIVIGNQQNAIDVTSVSANDGNWHHICVTWENTQGVWKFYKDGFLDGMGSGACLNHVIEDEGILMLGQNQGDLREDKCFIGMLAHVNIWDHVLTQENITALSQSCLTGIGNVLKWLDFKKGLQGNVTVVIPSPCQP